MREIKFRYVYQHEETGRITTRVFDFETISNGRAFIAVSKGYPVIAKNQYTGLKDKNGVEIYEGDIVATDSLKRKGKTYWHNIEVVEFSFEPFSDGEYGGECYGYLFSANLESYEIIGNIYQNPELINSQ